MIIYRPEEILEKEEYCFMKNLKVITKMSLIGLTVLAFVIFSICFSINSMNAVKQQTIKEEEKNIKFGDRVADKITKFVGSWTFILGFSSFLIIWIMINLYMLDNLDPYPFILLNLVLSCIAALQAPVIMMSQNREAKRDSLRSKNDYRTDLKSELILEELHNKIENIEKNQKEILKLLESRKK